MTTFHVTYQETRDYLAHLDRAQVVKLLEPVYPDLDIPSYTNAQLAALLNAAVKVDDNGPQLHEAIHQHAEQSSTPVHNFWAASMAHTP